MVSRALELDLEDADSTWMRGAQFSRCRTYRYRLWRVWDRVLPQALFIMLNPSTADEEANDPTIERCQRRTQAMGLGGLQVVNLFALRSTDPAALRKHADPVGPVNNDAIRLEAQMAAIGGGLIVCAWGSHGGYLGRGAAVQNMLVQQGIPLWCLGRTRSGEPRHPLYVSYDTALQPWNG